MSESMNSRRMTRLISALCGCLFLHCGVGNAQDRDNLEINLLGRLISLGIALDNPAALISTLQGADGDLAFPKSEASVNALTAVIRDMPSNVRPSASGLWDLAAVQAARTLGGLHEKDWIPIARGRLPRIKDVGVRIDMSAALASAGCYDGWPTIYENLLLRYDALISVPSFVGMKHPDGSEVDLEPLLAGLIPSMREDLRKHASAVVSEIRKKKKH
jgi:hypothetical protein